MSHPVCQRNRKPFGSEKDKLPRCALYRQCDFGVSPGLETNSQGRITVVILRWLVLAGTNLRSCLILGRGSRIVEVSRRPGDSLQKPRNQIRSASFYLREKFTRMLVMTLTGLPSFFPGMNFHCSTAATAASSSP